MPAGVVSNPTVTCSSSIFSSKEVIGKNDELYDFKKLIAFKGLEIMEVIIDKNDYINIMCKRNNKKFTLKIEGSVIKLLDAKGDFVFEAGYKETQPFFSYPIFYGNQPEQTTTSASGYWSWSASTTSIANMAIGGK